MNTIPVSRFGRQVFVCLTLLSLVGLLLGTPAEARRYLANSVSGPDGEGDPLDGNDYSSGGGGFIDGDVHENAGFIDSAVGGVIIDAPLGKAQVFIILDFQGRVPVLRFVQISQSAVMVEGPDAR